MTSKEVKTKGQDGQEGDVRARTSYELMILIPKL